MSRIAVTGAAGPVGRRLVELLLGDDDVSEVVALDRRPLDHDDARVRVHQVHLREADLDELLCGVDTICHLAGSDPLEGTAIDHDLHTSARVLAAADRQGVGHVILRTSATVYGAWPDNPVPLTEADELRPNDDSPWVQIRVKVEERARDFLADHPDAVVAVVRPCVTVSEDGPDELGRVLATARLVVSADEEAPVQFVHADDVAAAVDAIRRTRAAGAFNVAPDGWLAAGQTRALVGGVPSVRLPGRFVGVLAALGWRLRVAPTPPGFAAFVTNPWVVANDRLRQLGWEPTMSNDEAFVAAHDAAPWAQISPKRRQELALGLAVAGVAGALAGTAVALRRLLRR